MAEDWDENNTSMFNDLSMINEMQDKIEFKDQHQENLIDLDKKSGPSKQEQEKNFLQTPQDDLCTPSKDIRGSICINPFTLDAAKDHDNIALNRLSIKLPIDQFGAFNTKQDLSTKSFKSISALKINKSQTKEKPFFEVRKDKKSGMK